VCERVRDAVVGFTEITVKETWEQKRYVKTLGVFLVHTWHSCLSTECKPRVLALL